MKAENQRAKILFFDDDTDILELYSLLLSSRGFEVHTCPTSGEVLQEVTMVRPDLIFMDNWLPGIGGTQAIQQLKAHPELGSIPVVFCSGHADAPYLSKEAGADAYLLKPFDLEQLEAMIRSMLVRNGTMEAVG